MCSKAKLKKFNNTHTHTHAHTHTKKNTWRQTNDSVCVCVCVCVRERESPKPSPHNLTSNTFFTTITHPNISMLYQVIFCDIPFWLVFAHSFCIHLKPYHSQFPCHIGYPFPAPPPPPIPPLPLHSHPPPIKYCFKYTTHFLWASSL